MATLTARRVCNTPDCETVLSQYGDGRFCARHEPAWDYSDDLPLDEYKPGPLDAFGRGCAGAGLPPVDGVCSECGQGFTLRKDGTVRWHKSGLVARPWRTDGPLWFDRWVRSAGAI